MNGTRMEHIFMLDINVKHLFMGFGNPDTPLFPPPSEDKISVYILNTDPNAGEHWCIGVFFPHPMRCFFFDSYGRSPEFYHLSSILLPYSKKLDYNTKCVQGPVAKTCGHHCIYFTLLIGSGHSPEDIINSYSSSTTKNDNMVHNFVTHYFGTIISKIE
jgi:hypothetical protein